jgi:hypothetical protein
MPDKIEINFVVHHGKLENQALLLAASLRYFNGDDFILNACIPKDFGGIKSGITALTKNKLIELNANLKEVENPISTDYLIGNKLLCLDNSNDNYRVFLDTDIMCCDKLIFPQLEKNSIALKPADRKTYQWDKKTWEKAYHEFANYSLQDEDLVISTAFNETMLPYFNAGVIIVNGCKPFSQQWSKISRNLDSDTQFYGKRPWLDQLALPLTIKKLKLSLICLNEIHNFPANIKLVENTNIQLTHYHRPELIARSPHLISIIKKISGAFPWVNNLFKSKEWDCIGKMTPCSPINQTSTFLITGIPGSRTEIFSKIIPSTNYLNIAHCEQKTLNPLKKRNIPWGVAGYFSDINRDNTLYGNNLVNKFVISNELSYITSLQRLFLVLPTTKFIGLFSDPLTAINDWLNNLENNFLSQIEIIDNNKKWLSCDENKQLDQITNTENRITQLALWWNFFALQLLKNKHKLVLIDVVDLNQSTYDVISTLFDKKDIKLDLTKVNPDKAPSILNSREKQQVLNLTSQVYSELLYESKSFLYIVS